MPHDPQTLLEDVRRAAQLIVDFTTGKVARGLQDGWYALCGS